MYTVVNDREKYILRTAQKMLKSLPQKYQEVLVLRFADKKKVKDIGLILKKREGTVKSLLSRGLVLLRQQMQTQLNAKKSIVDNEGRFNQSPARKEYER